MIWKLQTLLSVFFNHSPLLQCTRRFCALLTFLKCFTKQGTHWGKWGWSRQSNNHGWDFLPVLPCWVTVGIHQQKITLLHFWVDIFPLGSSKVTSTYQAALHYFLFLLFAHPKKQTNLNQRRLLWAFNLISFGLFLWAKHSSGIFNNAKKKRKTQQVASGSVPPKWCQYLRKHRLRARTNWYYAGPKTLVARCREELCIMGLGLGLS